MMCQRRRRQFLLATSALLGTSLARAQAQRRFRIAWFTSTVAVVDTASLQSESPTFAALVAELRTLGYVQGGNIDFDVVSGYGHSEAYAELAAALVRRKPDVILVTGSQIAVATKKATATIPIVMSASADPVKYGLIATLARPGGNVTGISADSGPEIEVKRLQLLKETVPSISRVSSLSTKWIWEGPFGQELRRSGNLLGLQLEFTELVPKDLQGTFQRVKAQRPDGLFVLLAPELMPLRQQMADLAISAQLPTAVPFSEMVVAGSLLSYGFDNRDLYRRAAHYVDKILRGTRPADLPVQLPNKFEFVINARTAKTLGIKIPQSILTRADRVIA
jgi:putative tryptophan/tyrosine transport system substrate-binding protein